MSAETYKKIKDQVFATFIRDANPRLTYHNLFHTKDVLTQALNIARREGIRDEEQLFLLKIAALYHDVGCLYVYRGHEEKSCELVCRDMKAYGLTEEQYKVICGLIMATKLPQRPLTKLEQVLCDADIDYLGRDDFFEISDQLRLEFLEFGIVKNEKEWQETQIRFFENHHYFTPSSVRLRSGKKLQRLQELKKRYHELF